MKLQDASQEIWERKYKVEGLDNTLEDNFKRVAKAMASVEKPEDQGRWEKEFLWALENGAIPAGRILSNAGAEQHKPSVSMINCTVSAHIEDSMTGILEAVKNAGITLKSGAGIGYCFSTLRPKGAFVSGAGSTTSGPLPFMDIFDAMCKTVSSAGGRRGAQMGTFDVSHPDIMDFIRAKREDGRLRHFNLSALITADFIEAVKTDAVWKLVFPVSQRQMRVEKLDLQNPNEIVWRDWPTDDGYISNKEGKKACKVYQTLPAREVWNAIMKSTYDFAEPGFILIDEVNRMNNVWWDENIIATNPCGEQPLPENGACLLGSVNLTKFVRNPFTEQSSFDMDRFKKVVSVFTRMLDNVVEINGLPLPEQDQEMRRKRRHGMGYLGLGSAMTMLGIVYGSKESLEFTDSVSMALAIEGWKQSLELAKEKGVAPIMNERFIITKKMLEARPEMANDCLREGESLSGKVLLFLYSKYMQRIAEVEPELVKQLAIHGGRFTHHSSIAPTGTISFSVGNNASNGIEPSFSHSYMRNVIKEGKKTKEQMEVMSHEFLMYRKMHPEAQVDNLPESFVSADSITPRQHIDVQAAAQRWIDSSISKTINVPTSFPYEKFKDIYLYAVEKGLKGCTTFRFNPEAFQGVLVKQDDLANTTYSFTLEDGSVLEVRGDEQIEYDGEIHVAANLFDAIKEGTYGKY